MSVAIIADSGSALEAITSTVAALPSLHIVRHHYGRTSVGASLAQFRPELVVVDEMHWPKLALQRIAEVHALLPQAKVVVRASRPEALWLADALRNGASAVVPQTAGPAMLAVVLQEVTATPAVAIQPDPVPVAA